MEKVDKQPDGPGGVARKAALNENAEVAGRARPYLYTCPNDGAGNYIDLDWKWFSCWRCGQMYTF
jgi:hypothetical protein